jgi:hypothetical protein
MCWPMGCAFLAPQGGPNSEQRKWHCIPVLGMMTVPVYLRGTRLACHQVSGQHVQHLLCQEEDLCTAVGSDWAPRPGSLPSGHCEALSQALPSSIPLFPPPQNSTQKQAILCAHPNCNLVLFTSPLPAHGQLRLAHCQLPLSHSLQQSSLWFPETMLPSTPRLCPKLLKGGSHPVHQETPH